jgi:hypothetical protein
MKNWQNKHGKMPAARYQTSMHTSRELNSKLFQIKESGRIFASFAELCPGFTTQDRLGVIVREPLAAIWNSAFILAAVTSFYDEQRKRGREFFIYPDYFVFHIGCKPGDYSMFDIWPQHKCLCVGDDAEEISCAINDRAISILLLNQLLQREVQLQEHTRNSALARIKYAFAGVPGNAPDAVTIKGDSVIERYNNAVINASESVAEVEREALRSRRRIATHNNCTTEWYQRLPVEVALNCL